MHQLSSQTSVLVLKDDHSKPVERVGWGVGSKRAVVAVEGSCSVGPVHSTEEDRASEALELVSSKRRKPGAADEGVIHLGSEVVSMARHLDFACSDAPGSG